MAEQSPLMGLLSSGSDVATRGGLLPYLTRVVPDIGGDDISEFEGPLEFATPSLLYDPVRNMALTGAMLRGQIPVDEGLLTQTMVDAPLVGGLLGTATGAVPRGAVLGAFAGRGAATADTRALGKAMSMEGRGASRDEIWDETGRMGQHWYKDVDGEWKFEIPDNLTRVRDTRAEPKVTAGKIYRVQDVLEHPALYDAYAGTGRPYGELKSEMQKLGSPIDY